MYYPSISNEFQKDQPSVHAISSAPPQPTLSNLEDTVATGIPVPSENQISSADPGDRPPPPPLKNGNNNISLSPGPAGSWSTGLCDCFCDLNTCCLTFWCPCVSFGRIAEIVDRGSTSCGTSGTLYTLIMCLTGCSCMYSCFYRSKLRGQYFLEESPCPDCCVHCFCEECALCQEYRELKNRGFDLSIGWHGNMERQKRLSATAPPTEEKMTR